MPTLSPVNSQIPPHGGRLCERLVHGDGAHQLLEEANGLHSIAIDRRDLANLRLLGLGILSPLNGFMTQPEYDSVVEHMRLSDGLPWTIPITLQIGAIEASQLRTTQRVSLVFGKRIIAVMDIADVYEPDRTIEAKRVYGTDEPQHPGVNIVYEQGEFYVGGDVHVIDLAFDLEGEIAPYFISPRQTRKLFTERNWRRVVAFQTRNPIHRAHEYLQKCALEMVDGLFINPLAGETKSDDIDVFTRFDCYEQLITNYYPKDRVLLGAFPASMRYAGPREAVFHAICRKNYGCTHFIVGRDHAGVGSYYGTYDAQRIFDEFRPDEIGIEPIRFDHAFFCRVCGSMASSKTCPHPDKDHMTLSGTKVREMIARGQSPPPEYTRPEIAKTLIRKAGKGATAHAGGNRKTRRRVKR